MLRCNKIGILHLFLIGFLFIHSVKAESKTNRIGVLWSSWDPSHFQNYWSYINQLDSWGINYVSLNPTYFIDTYEEGITTELWGNTKTPSIDLQKEVIKELIKRGYVINFRPHIDPIKYAMPLGETRDQWSSNPGGRDWRGKFDRFDPTDRGIGYVEKVILPSLQVMAESIREAGAPVRPIRFDLGAELMDSMLYFPEQWIDLLSLVRHALATEYKDVASHIVLSHNFCHHIALLLRLPGHKNYLERIHPLQIVDSEAQYLDRPGISDNTRRLIGQYIASLDEMSLSQYLPLDIFNEGNDPRDTSPEQVAAALLHHEKEFIQEVLMAELGIKEDELPVMHVGEYGMGWRGLVAPNVWDYASWIKNGAGDLIISESEQMMHAAIGIEGVIRYISQSPTRYQSLLLWLGGKPYDVIGLNSYSEGWYNHSAADALGTYWWEHREVLTRER